MNLLSNKNFYPTFWSQLLGALNDNLFKNALVILVTFKIVSTHSSNLVVLAGALFVLPFFLFSAFAGELSDKYPKNVLTKNLKLLELGIVLIGSAGFLFHQLPLLFLCLFLLGAQSTLYGPIKYSILPELLPEESLVKANAFVEMGTFLAILIGTISGGVFINFPQGEWIVSSSCVALAVIGYLISFKIPKLEPIKANHKISMNLWALNKKNFKLVYPQKNVFLTILGISWFWFLGACLLSIFPILVKDFLKGQEGVVTFLLAVFSIGIALGSLICEHISKKHLELGLVPLGSLGMFAFLVDLFFALNSYSYQGPLQTLSQFFQQSGSFRIILDLALFSVFSGFYTVPLYTYLQVRTKREDRSQIIAFNNILNALFMVVGAGFLGVILPIMTMPQVILSMATLTFLVSGYVYFFMPEFLWRLICFFLTNFIYKFNTKNIPTFNPDDKIVFTSNHISFVDWLLISASINRPVRFVMYHKIYKNPFLLFLFKGAKVIPIAPIKEDEKIYNQAFRDIKEALDNKELVCIFPEGKISPDGSVQEFKSGIEKVVKENKVDVQPLVIRGMHGSFFSRTDGPAFSNPWLLISRWRSKVEIEALPKVLSDQVSAKSLEDLTKTAL